MSAGDSATHDNRLIVLRARVVLPVASPPIEDGAIGISGNRIVYAGLWRDAPHAAGNVRDLGEVILLPGLVNAHCHLDYTNMAGQLAPPASFTDWIKLITTGKSGMLYTDFAESWLAGAHMLVRTGTTTVGDIEMSPELLPEVWSATPLRVYSFLEMTGVKSRRAPAEIVQEAADKIASLPMGRCRAGISPHAPYSTTPELLRLSAQLARNRNLRVTTHVAESWEEFEMYMYGRGKLHEWLSHSGRDMTDCGQCSPVQHLERQGALSRRLLVVHANYCAPGDAALLGGWQVSVVHCPRSHFYFKHQRFPLEELAAANVNICLGTDSLASVYQARKQVSELNMFDEMRALATSHPEVTPETILRMATINGAQALGMKGEIGELTSNACADCIAIPFAGNISASHEAVLAHTGNVNVSMIDGQWAVGP